MDSQAFKESVTERISNASNLYVKDLEAIDEPKLGQSPGGVARSPYDFTYEVVFVNKRVAQRLRGEVPEKFDFEGWMKAPEEFKTKSVAVKALRDSCDEVLEAWNAMPASDMDKKIVLGDNSESNPLRMANLCATHLVYHDAQLNYIQSLTGDDEMHWD
jgi:hypothetical protein